QPEGRADARLRVREGQGHHGRYRRWTAGRPQVRWRESFQFRPRGRGTEAPEGPALRADHRARAQKRHDPWRGPVRRLHHHQADGTDELGPERRDEVGVRRPLRQGERSAGSPLPRGQEDRFEGLQPAVHRDAGHRAESRAGPQVVGVRRRSEGARQPGLPCGSGQGVQGKGRRQGHHDGQRSRTPVRDRVGQPHDGPLRS
ncbi:MAG: hypothetical protein UT02_C0031G0013, partial [Parcubacteria group bacterium GW2011_GWC2_38_7]